MARLTVTGSSGVDLVVLSAGFGRDGLGAIADGPGVSTYSWTTAAGLLAAATGPFGAFAQDAFGVPSGRAFQLELTLDEETSLLIEDDRPAFRIGRLAAGDPPGEAFDRLLAGRDRFETSTRGDARLFGDALVPEAIDAGRADVFVFGGAGGRQAAGDFQIVGSTATSVAGGDDVLVFGGTGRIAGWGDVATALDKADRDGAEIRGGDDRLDAREALAGLRRPPAAVLVGDVGALGLGWTLAAGDDLLIAPKAAPAILVGDALGAEGLARVFAGDDVLRGGAGDDRLVGDVQDVLDAGAQLQPGADLLRGGRGDDWIWGDVRGDAGADLLDPGGPKGTAPGGDRIDAGAGADRAWGGWGDDRLLGGDGRDRLWGGDDDDRLQGGTGNDRLSGGTGADLLQGEEGRDRLEGDRGADRLLGGADDDRLRGGAEADRLEGGTGRDALLGGEGADRLSGGAGDDALLGGGGADLARGGEGADVMSGGGGDDDLRGEAGADQARGGAGDDLILGGAGDDVLSGGAGDDRLLGGEGEDRLFAGGGGDRMAGGPGRDRLTCGAGRDALVLAAGDGADLVARFDPDHDRLALGHGMGTVQVVQTARGLKLTGPEASLLFEGLTRAMFDPADHPWLA